MLRIKDLKAKKIKSELTKLIKEDISKEKTAYISMLNLGSKSSLGLYVKLIKVLNELSVVGFPPLVEAAQSILETKSLTKKLSLPLSSTLKRMGSTVCKESEALEQQFQTQEEEHLLNQLEALLDDLELMLSLKNLNDLELFREILWLGATRWLMSEAVSKNDLMLRRQLIVLSDMLGHILEVDPKRFEKEAINLIFEHWSTYSRAGGVLVVYLPGAGNKSECNQLKESGLLCDFRGLKTLKLSGYKALTWLQTKTTIGLENLEEIQLDVMTDKELLSLVDSPLLDQVLRGAQSQTRRTEASGELLTRLEQATCPEPVKQQIIELAEKAGAHKVFNVHDEQLTFNYIPKNFADPESKAFWMQQTATLLRTFQNIAGYVPEGQYKKHLLDRVMWTECIQFCNQLSEFLGLSVHYQAVDEKQLEKGFNLLTQANGFFVPLKKEWCFAARGGEEFRFAGSHEYDDVAVYHGDKPARKKPNAYGLYDMNGCVGEWCADDEENLGYYAVKAKKLRICLGYGKNIINKHHWASTHTTDRMGNTHGMRLCLTL